MRFLGLADDFSIDLYSTVIHVKGTVSQDFWPFFALKIRSGPHMNRHKWFQELFYFYKDVCKQRVSTTMLTRCQRSQQFRRHDVSMVKNNADMVSAWSATSRTLRQRTQNYFTLKN